MNDQVRHWVANARGSQIGSAVGAIAVVVVFIGASVVMAPGSDTDADVAASAVPGDAPGSFEGDAPATGSDASGPPSARGPSGSGGGAGPSGTARAGATGAPGGGGPTPHSEELVASDRGVTESTIKIGFLIGNDALEDSGFSTNQRSDATKYIQGLVDYVNTRGGAAGRKVEHVVRPTDPTSTDDQSAACQSMLVDHQVFGVIDVALSNGPAQSCIAQEGVTPYAHLITWSREFMAAANGYDIGYAAAIDRIALTLARDLAASGWMNGGSVLGLFGDNCPTTKPTVDDVLVPALEKLVDRVVVGLHDCTIDAVVRQPPSIATQFRTAGVDHVISVANFISTQIFLQTAEGFGWSPTYAVSDWFAGVSDSTSASYDPNQFDGAIGLTSTRGPLANANRPPHEGIDRCNEVAVEAGLAPVNGAEADVDAVLCDLFFLMVDGINGAAPNPTRPAWAAAIQALGARNSAVWGRSSFAPGKTTGADEVYTAVWHRDCTCWRAESDFRRMAA